MASIKHICLEHILAGRPQKATQFLLGQYNLYEDNDAILCYKMWCKIRSEFHRHQEHANPHYRDYLASLLELNTLVPEDRRKIQNLLDASLADQYKVFKSKQPYLTDIYFDTAIKSIYPALPSIYEFDLPATFKIRARNLAQHQDEARISTGAISICTPTEARQVLETTLKLLEAMRFSSITSSSECIDRIVCLQVVTGRRFQELSRTASFFPHPQYPYQCLVEGLLKSSSIETTRHEIPILAPFELISQTLHDIRVYASDHILPNNYVKRRCQALFGFPFIHGSLRNLYLELAFHDRARSRFYPVAPRTYFDMKALCHQHVLTPTMSYQRLQFT